MSRASDILKKILGEGYDNPLMNTDDQEKELQDVVPEKDNEESAFDKLSDTVADKEDMSKEDADKVAYSVGVKKYGKEGMEDKAQAGKEKAEESRAAKILKSIKK